MTASVARAPVRYVGLTTRAIALALDASVINVVAVVVGAGLSLIVSILHLPKDVRTVLLAIGGVAYIAWVIGYLVVFWSTTGQTPGNRVMQFRVVGSDGKLIKPRRAFVRVIGLVLAALPLLLGYLPILFDSRRRGLQDWIARTVVIEAPQVQLAEVRRARRRDETRRRRAGLDVVGVPATMGGVLDSNS